MFLYAHRGSRTANLISSMRLFETLEDVVKYMDENDSWGSKCYEFSTGTAKKVPQVKLDNIRDLKEFCKKEPPEIPF